jgi:hypothetical protein
MSTVVYGWLPPGFMQVLAERLNKRRDKNRALAVLRSE